ncbi:probable protein phosphatase 2C 4 [Andrographis paniculata]|uniref:probable protein phosphatase 2C 4 n=1 Tax=Andrographis paniculata TaxID=175694 RepID=UPI0021E7D614|nr:probable protein phosphatase 2C 4 [Andrographis paniculata]
MGNKIGRLSRCFAAGDISRRRNDVAAAEYLPDEGFGHSFCYIPPENTSPYKPPSAPPKTTAYRTISGAAISANASTPLSTADPFSGAADKAASFESTNFFSSIPLQPIPRNSIDAAVKSGPILQNPAAAAAAGSGPIERGFLSGPIERSFQSGPLDLYRPQSKKRAFVKNVKRAIHKSFWTFSKHLNAIEERRRSSTPATGTTSSGASSDVSLVDENDDVSNEESFGSPSVQWAQGKAGEDRVHVAVSDDDAGAGAGWVFVGIYDGFNGPDATDYLLTNLYPNVRRELKGLLWSESDIVRMPPPPPDSSKSLDSAERIDLDRRLREKLDNLGPDGVAGNNSRINHVRVLKALSEALKKTEALFLETSNSMLLENPELALMGSCVLVMVMKGDDLYLMNVGDSRGVLAHHGEDCPPEEKIQDGYEYDENMDGLCSWQLTMEHSTCVKEEVRRIRNAHQDDAFAVINGRVKGSLKVTRAFGAGFLKHPKWNNALLEMFRIDYVGTSPYIVCSPSLCHHRLRRKDKFLILSSDGLYQYFTNEEAVSEVEMFVSTFPEGDPAQHLVEEVLFRAARRAGLDFHELLAIPQGDRRRYHDDVSIVIISFEGRIWRSSA